MAANTYYLLTFLPALGDLSSTAPMKPGEMLSSIEEAPGLRQVVEAIFLSDDLLQREGYLSGEVKELEPAVLTAGQCGDEEPLPDYLTNGEKEIRWKVPEDDLWNRYFHYVWESARINWNEFLQLWVRHEVSLRNALAVRRAKALELEPLDYVVATDLVSLERDFNGVINEWSAARTPLAGMQVLDQARWDWLTEHDSWFEFSGDEVAAYGAKLILLHRVGRLRRAEANGTRPQENESAKNRERVTP